MLPTTANGRATRTGFRSICGVNVHNLYATRFCFLFNKFTQLVERPAMQSGTDLFTCFNPIANVFEVFHYNHRTLISLSFLKNRFCNTVIDVTNFALFSARDIPQPLLCRLRTVALKAPSMSQKLISFSSQIPSPQQLTCGGSSQHVFSQIYTDRLSRLS